MEQENNKNFIIALVLSVLIFIGWQVFYTGPMMEAERARLAEIEANKKTVQAPQNTVSNLGSASDEGVSSHPAENISPSASARSDMNSADQLANELNAPRLKFENSAIIGTVNLKGGRIDDLTLKTYRQDLDPKSDPITLFKPSGDNTAFYAEFGVVGGNGTPDTLLPNNKSVWSIVEGDMLTPQSPVVLRFDSGQGFAIERRVELDDETLFTISDQLINTTQQPLVVYPYGLVSKHSRPKTQAFFILHEGMVGRFGDEIGLQEFSYKDMDEKNTQLFEASDGWLGITDKYWGAALIPQKGQSFKARFLKQPQSDKFQADYLYNSVEIAPDQSVTLTQHLFAGAKSVEVIDNYEKKLGLKSFDLLVDWGWFYVITKPLFYLIHWFNGFLGNFGLAIIAVTLLIRFIMFPLANKSYESMSRMKKVQPDLVAIRDRYKDDKLKQQQEMMALYKKEKINPMSGCLPILFQIPVFFAIYKVLFVTIDMRHAPFYGWIQDLAAPDPTSIFNLFGLLPYAVPDFLMIGVWPLLMGITMFLQMQMNPAPQDKTQQMIFNIMPIVFTFMLARFPAGLVIYWTVSNTFSILQQWIIMRKNGVSVALLDNILTLFGKKNV